MTREELIKHLHEALNSVDITFPYRYVLVEAIEALSQPSFPEGLEEAAREYANRGISSNADPYEETIAYQADKDAFKAGAQWRDAQIPKLSDSAEEAAEEYEEEYGKYLYGLSTAFKAGAEWMERQGITEMSRLYRDPNPPHEGLFFGVLPFFSTVQMALNYQDGEEVIVQIRKK